MMIASENENVTGEPSSTNCLAYVMSIVLADILGRKRAEVIEQLILGDHQ